MTTSDCEHKTTVAPTLRALINADPAEFKISDILEMMRQTPNTWQEVDRAYEIAVHSLFEAIITDIESEITASIPPANEDMAREFFDLSQRLLGVDAADRDFDMWMELTFDTQVKYIDLTPGISRGVPDKEEHNRIVIVCQDADQAVIRRILSLTSWWRKVQGVVKESELVEWYEKCLRGRFSDRLATRLLELLREQFRSEFPQAATLTDFLEERGYLTITCPPLWEPPTAQ